MLSGRKFFWGPHRCGYWGFKVKCVSGCWELTFQNGDRLGWAEGVHRRYSRRTCLVSPLGMGSENEERPEQKVFSRARGTGVSLRNWAWRNGRRDEDLQLAYLLASWSILWVPRSACWSRGLGQSK